MTVGLSRAIQLLERHDAKSLRDDANTRGLVAEQARKLSAKIDTLF